ncbi:uncharacterized protein LOC142231404 [Haematobia irritans]|uniref:uncharacterized protein LOC142231404 n=1 Tax=Haematobia irritans TaxID=7368 RepID=UPI003F50A384
MKLFLSASLAFMLVIVVGQVPQILAQEADHGHHDGLLGGLLGGLFNHHGVETVTHDQHAMGLHTFGHGHHGHFGYQTVDYGQGAPVQMDTYDGSGQGASEIVANADMGKANELKDLKVRGNHKYRIFIMYTKNVQTKF